MDWESYNNMCENAEFGKWLVEVIAKSIGIEPDPEKIDRAIYNGTSCGAWVKFDVLGILVGTIVEGSESEYVERIHLTDDEMELCKRFWEAIENCENFVNDVLAEEECDNE